MYVEKKTLLVSLGWLSLTGAAAHAHHSYTMFDLNRTLTLEGTVKEFQWTNPHVWIQVTVKDPVTGRETEWSVESDSPNMLKRRGWLRTSLKPGDKAVLVIHPAKLNDKGNRGALESVTVDGKQVGELGSKPQGGARP